MNKLQYKEYLKSDDWRLFGFKNFPKAGWQDMIIGQEWPKETITQFLYLKNKHLKG